MESEENRKQVFTPFPPPLEIAIKCDFHIPTAATATGSLRRSNPNRSPAHCEGLRIDSRTIPKRQLQEPNPVLAVLVLTHTKQRGGRKNYIRAERVSDAAR